MPRNGLPVTLAFTKQVLADVVGTAATTLLQNMKSSSFLENPSEVLKLPDSTILVTEDFKSKLVASNELGNHTSCRLGRVQQRMTIPLPDVVLQLRQMNRVNVLDIITPHLEEVFDDIKRNSLSVNKDESALIIDKISGTQSVVIQGLITIEEDLSQDFIFVSWIGTPMADMVADCALGIVYQSLSANHYLRSFWNDVHIKSSQHDVKSSASVSHHHHHDHSHDDTDKKRKEEENTQAEQVIKRMKLGLLDPSQSFKKLDSKEVQSIEKNSLPENRMKLEKILNYLKFISSEKIQEVLISQDGLRLIIRGCSPDIEVTSETTPIEAYLYIHWSINRGHTLHHAVVQCVDESFRKYLISLIQTLESSEHQS